MPSQDKSTRLWTGRVRLQGFPQKVRKGFKTKKKATEWELQTRKELLQPVEMTLTFSQGSNKYLQYCQKRFQKNTYRQKTFIFRSMITYWQDDYLLSEITTLLVESYLDQRYEAKGGKTANRDLREIKTLYNWLINKGYFDKNPAVRVEKYHEDQFIKYVPPIEDIKAVLLAASPEEYDFIMVLYHTAGRMSEIVNLTWEDINFDKGTIRLWTNKRKFGREYDELILNSILYDILSKRYEKRIKDSSFVFTSIDGSKSSKNTWDNVMPKLCKKAGVKKFGFHSIRHHVAAIMADSKKLSLIEIQKQLRQKRATTTDTYLKSLVTGENRSASVLETASINMVKDDEIDNAPKLKLNK